MEELGINPKVANELAYADAEILLSKRGRKYRFVVKIGPYVVAEGQRRSRERARDDAAEALERAILWLRRKAGEN